MSELLYSPVNGIKTRLENVNDLMFSEKMLGDGIAVIPKEDNFYSPVDGEITLVYSTQHAIGIKTKSGTDILIHIGIDTVELGGKPFDIHVKLGDKVKTGDLLTIINWGMICDKGLDRIVPIIVMEKKVVLGETEGEIKKGESLLEIE